MEPNVVRAAMRIHAALLLREQTELIREARMRMAAGRTIESQDSVVLPGVRWEMIADTEQKTILTRLVGAPAWISTVVVGEEFWIIPIEPE